MSLQSSVGLWDAISFWFITAGIIVTFIGGVAAIRFRHWNRILTAEQEAARVKEKADSEKAIASLGLEIAQANERAAEANKAAEQERLARLQLESTLAPRTLSPDQIQALADRLRPFGAQKVDTVLFSNDGEVIKLSDQIDAGLRLASWTETVWGAGTGPSTVIGIVVSVSSDADESAQQAAKGLTQGLIEQHIAAVFDSTPFEKTMMPPPGVLLGPVWVKENSSKIRMFIGKKS